MKKPDNRKVLLNAPFSYTYNRIVLDENNIPVDFTFLDINPAFEHLTGHERSEIINKTIREIFAGIEKDSFDWIKEYGTIALHGGKKEFEQFSSYFNKWFKVYAYSEEKLYFTTIIYDITELKKTNQELKESKDHLNNLLSNNPVIIYSNTIKGEKVKITHISGNLIKILGIKPEYFINDFSMWKMHIHPEDIQIIQDAIIQLKEQQSFKLEYRFKDINGEYHWISDHARVIHADKDQTMIIGSWFDITETKNSEQQLKIFKESIDNSTDAIGISTPEGKHYYQNFAFDKMFGKIGENPIEKVYVDKKLGEEVFKTIKKGGTWMGEIRMFNKAQQELDILLKAYGVRDEKGNIRALVGVHTDITNFKNTEKSLSEQNQKIAAIMKALPDIMFVLDTNGNFLDFYCSNPARLAIPPEKIIGSSIRDLFEENEARQHIALYKKCVSEQSLQNIEYFITLGGSKRYFEARIAPLTENKVLSIIRDVTDNKQAEKEREFLLNQLNHSKKMESIGLLAGGIAHDFNNMLTVITGNADLALHKAENMISNKDELLEIKKASSHSSEMVQQLLAFARKQVTEPQVIDINRAIKNMLKMLKRLIGENIELILTPSKEELWTKIDPSQLNQLITNLCINARDAIDDTGKIIISTGSVFIGKEDIVTKPVSVPGNYIIIRIIDDGKGMEEEILPKIFDPFFSSKEVGQGTGLGLSTVYGIVKQNKGFIDVTSKPETGTSFSIFLPEHMPEYQNKSADIKLKSKTGGKEAILIVEDQREILEIATKILSSHGYTIFSALTPNEAIITAKDKNIHIDLLITDIIMPEMNGRDLSEIIKGIFPDLKCLYISGYPSNVLSHNRSKEKEINFLQKPFTIKDLLTTVGNILGK